MHVLALEKSTLCFLIEAVRSALDEVGRLKIDAVRRVEAVQETRTLANLYGHARRVRDYLQRANGPVQDQITIELTDDDADLLASCSLHEIGRIELTLNGDDPVNAADRRWLTTKRNILAQMIEQLATRPIDRIPSTEAVALTTPTVRLILSRLRARTRLVNPFRDDRLLEAFGFGGGGTPNFGMPRRTVAEATAWDPIEKTDQQEHENRKDGHFEEMSGWNEAPPPPVQQEPMIPPIVDAQRLREPRLRGLLQMDLKSYERARDAKDWRMAVVHLTSVLEGLLVDAALPKAAALGLKGGPETWQIHELFDRVMADAGRAGDKAFVLQLTAVRNMIRPATQLHSPVVVTSATHEQAEGLVRRVVSVLMLDGLTLRPEPAPQDL